MAAGNLALTWGHVGSSLATNPALIAAACTALLGLIGSVAAAYITKRSKDQELFLTALSLLTGGTQKRSVGIAIITKYAEQRGMRDVAALIFNAQKKHLEDMGHHLEGKGRSIEKYNYDEMDRITRHWKSYDCEYWDREISSRAYGALRIEIIRARPAPQDGLELDRETANVAVRRWLREVANVRVHATTGEVPRDRLEVERAKLASLPPPYSGKSTRAVVSTPRPIVGIQHPLSMYDSFAGVAA